MLTTQSRSRSPIQLGPLEARISVIPIRLTRNPAIYHLIKQTLSILSIGSLFLWERVTARFLAAVPNPGSNGTNKRGPWKDQKSRGGWNPNTPLTHGDHTRIDVIANGFGL